MKTSCEIPSSSQRIHLSRRGSVTPVTLSQYSFNRPRHRRGTVRESTPDPRPNRLNSDQKSTDLAATAMTPSRQSAASLSCRRKGDYTLMISAASTAATIPPATVMSQGFSHQGRLRSGMVAVADCAA